MNVCDLVPAGMENIYALLNVNRFELFKELKLLVPLLKKIHIVLFNFTLCTIPKDFPKKQYHNHIAKV